MWGLNFCEMFLHLLSRPYFIFHKDAQWLKIGQPFGTSQNAYSSFSTNALSLVGFETFNGNEKKKNGG